MKIIIIATEASGDFLGFHLINSLKKNFKNVNIKGVGGELMTSTGFNSWVSLKEFNTIGVIEVILRIIKFVKIFNFIKEKILKTKPDIIITIDSPSFSYRLTKKLQFLRKDGVKFFHYVAPTVWAWKSYRSKLFAKYYDKLFTLFEFEKKYFLDRNLETIFVGHQIFYSLSYIKKKKKNYYFLTRFERG